MDVRGLVGRLTVVQRVVIGLVLVVFAVLVAKVSGLALVFLLALGGWIYYRYRQNAQVAAARAEEEAKRAATERASQEKRRFVREKPPPEETSPAWPYEILGVARSATEKEVRTAYRALVWRHHPDHNQGDKSARERFMAVQAAYEELGYKP